MIEPKMYDSGFLKPSTSRCSKESLWPLWRWASTQCVGLGFTLRSVPCLEALCRQRACRFRGFPSWRLLCREQSVCSCMLSIPAFLIIATIWDGSVIVERSLWSGRGQYPVTPGRCCLRCPVPSTCARPAGFCSWAAGVGAGHRPRRGLWRLC